MKRNLFLIWYGMLATTMQAQLADSLSLQEVVVTGTAGGINLYTAVGNDEKKENFALLDASLTYAAVNF